MNDNLKDYKDKIMNIDSSEQIDRDLYLKKFHEGELYGPLTGDNFIDKPWTKNYNNEPVEKIDIYNTLYQNFRNTAEKYSNNNALFDLLGHKMTYSELLDKVDMAACAFEKMGLKENDKVAVLSTNTIDEPVSLLALNKIGVMVKFVDFSKDINDIKKSVEETDVKCLIIDEALLGMNDFINSKKLPIVVSGTEKYINESNIISYPSLYKIGEDKISKTVDFNSERPSLMITSSGTTGKPKPIIHTDFSVNSAALKILYTNFDLGNQNVMLKIIPAHIGLGVITTLYTSLISNNQVVLVSNGKGPEDSINNMVNFIANYNEFKRNNNINQDAKLNIFGAPMFYKAIVGNINRITDLSYIGTMLAAGAKMSEDELEQIHNVFKSKGCDKYIYNGYGQNEMGGAVTLNSNSNNYNGSAGFPVIGTEVRILDTETNEVLGFNQEGRIVEKTSSRFMNYDNLDEETKNSFIKLSDGSIWFDTKDKGYMNENGFVFVTGRLSRVMIKFNCKIPLEVVEEKIKTISNVKDCAVVTVNDNDENDISFAFVALKDSNIETNVVEDLSNTSKSLSDFEKPDNVIFIDNIPYYTNGKINYTLLQEEANKIYYSEKEKTL